MEKKPPLGIGQLKSLPEQPSNILVRNPLIGSDGLAPLPPEMLEEFLHVPRRRFNRQSQRVPHQRNIRPVAGSLDQAGFRILLILHLLVESVQNALQTALFHVFLGNWPVAYLRIRQLHSSE